MCLTSGSHIIVFSPKFSLGTCKSEAGRSVSRDAVTLGVFSDSHRSENSVGITLSDLSLTFRLLVKSPQYLLG